jgi:hypothetical protein
MKLRMNMKERNIKREVKQAANKERHTYTERRKTERKKGRRNKQTKAHREQ